MQKRLERKKAPRKASLYTGLVVQGDGVARRDFDVPTANLDLHRLPRVRYGVYAASIVLADHPMRGVVSWGPGKVRKFEAHLFDFEGDLLGKTLSVTLLKRVGEWIPWTSKERMRQKIWNDIAATHEWFATQDKRR